MNGSVKNEIDDIEQELNFEALTFQDVDNSNEIEKVWLISMEGTQPATIWLSQNDSIWEAF